ncbi:hypothetical protein D5F52_15115 [Brevibacillus laterosporus]|nr:hypothetical protein BrL25_15200 [Brevibacillus laterosporus DSM 25]AYB39501.1 hypothetical protein D5F52_15115 [Brevibacillus laterosporus]MBG9774566.1 hypothetical protein [Brevibacillus laterosporus]MBG9798358.1 hypothetical protein [Brevibacillus laterosporus]PPA82409.1 hypothetical protein C4A75_19085 [Brevibacillus laterosporus]
MNVTVPLGIENMIILCVGTTWKMIPHQGAVEALVEENLAAGGSANHLSSVESHHFSDGNHLSLVRHFSSGKNQICRVLFRKWRTLHD